MQFEVLKNDFAADDFIDKAPAGTLQFAPADLPFTDEVVPDTPDITADAATSERQARHFSGQSLDGWRTALGDARHTASGLSPVSVDDIITQHEETHSTLVANRSGRGVMAHNITYNRMVGDALDYVHHASLSFRTPTAPRPETGRPNGQTFEVGLFVWDGAGSRRDIGLAFQWVLNPWLDSANAIRTWTSTDEESRWSPDPVGRLDPSDSWHTAEMWLDAAGREAWLEIDGTPYEAQCTETQKPDNWAHKTAVAFQAELVSLWPDDRVTAPSTYAEVKDWWWRWEPRT